MSQLNKKKPEQMFGWLSKLKDKTLRVLFPNKWGGTNYHAYKWNLHQFYITPAIQWIKGCKVFLKFWKIPFAIQDLEQVGEDAIFASNQAIDKINSLNSTISGLIEDVVEQRFDQTPIQKVCQRMIIIKTATVKCLLNVAEIMMMILKIILPMQKLGTLNWTQSI